MPEHHHKSAITSPKRFLRAFQSSPLKLGSLIHSRRNSSHKRASEDNPEDNLDRSRSTPQSGFDFNDSTSPSFSPSIALQGSRPIHDTEHPTQQKLNHTKWKELIPPFPNSSAPLLLPTATLANTPNMNGHQNPSQNSGQNHHQRPEQRQTQPLNIHATATPYMLQPLTNKELEKLFGLHLENISKSSVLTTEHHEKPGLKLRKDLNSQPTAIYTGANSLASFLLAEKLAPFLKSGSQKDVSVSGFGQPQLAQRSKTTPKIVQRVHATNPPRTPPLNPALMVPILHQETSYAGGMKAPVAPPLVSQHLLHAVTMTQSLDLSSTLDLQQGHAQGSKTQQHLQNPQYQRNAPNNPSHLHHQKLRRPGTKKRKTCSACNLAISGQFVRALNNAYHIDCFKCFECGTLCLAKFFPHEIKPANGQRAQQVPLCEYDYFKKLSLICFSCDSALRGPYITALGKKYHLEHFKCYACGKVFDSDESYYEHDNNVYCHFHYSRLFATKCEGCSSSIVKQFVELFKSGKVQQWHPECYMVYKFWNVSVTIDTVGFPETQMSNTKRSPHTNEMSAKDLMLTEQRIEAAVMDCWVALSGFEEALAECISEMLLSACSGKRMAGLLTTGRLVLFLEVLFKGLDYVQHLCLEFRPENTGVSEWKRVLLEEVYSEDAFDKFQALRKEPRNISGKLMSYLAILRKSSDVTDSGTLSSELLAVITGCAHYLKLLIRIGLKNALTLNELRGDTKALDGFLQLLRKYEEVDAADKTPDKAAGAQNLIASRLAVPHNATDACCTCSKSIEKSCIMFATLRWHHKCFECSKCRRKPSSDFHVESFLCGSNDKTLCTDCAMSDLNSGMGYTSGFVGVSDLSQLVYLLKIALSRLRSAIKKDVLVTGITDNLNSSSSMTHIKEEPSETETTYSRTLDEVTSLRTQRESQKLGNSVKKNARKSVILEAPEAVAARTDDTSNHGHAASAMDKCGSSSSTRSFTVLRRDSDSFECHTNPVKIRDDPPQRLASISLDRTSDLLKNEKSLTLDDIPRIVAAEQAREQRPNAFKHHNSLYQKKKQHIRSVNNNLLPHEVARNPSVGGQRAEAKHKYFSELSKQEHIVLRHIAIEALLSISSQFSREDLLAMIQSKKLNTFWDKFKFGGDGDKGKAMSVFGVELKDVARKYGVDTGLGVGPSQLRIPMLIEDIILALRQKDMSVEGIFRLNGNIKNLRELTEQINAAPLKSPNYSNYSAVQLAALMKKWLRELSNPLLTFSLYDLWISSRREQNPAKTKRILQLSYCLLPRSHRNLLEVLLYFFSWVASFAEIDEETGSKMDTHNLATVLAPNILLSKAASGENGENQSSDAHFLAIEVVNQLIEIHEDLAVIPKDLWDFYNRCQFCEPTKADSVSTKEILSKIAKVSKENPDFFVEFMKKHSCSELSHQNSIRSGQTKVHNAERLVR